MRIEIRTLAALTLAGALTSAAQACDNSPDLARIPGATTEEAQRRYDSYERDLGVIARLESERAALEESWTVYLATIRNVKRGADSSVGATLSLQPVWPVRGQLPKGVQSLDRPFIGSSCVARGYLPITRDVPGALLVVFDRPGTKYAMSAEVARSGELINAISMYALKVDPDQFRER